jgi:hypothetical protein
MTMTNLESNLANPSTVSVMRPPDEECESAQWKTASVLNRGWRWWLLVLLIGILSLGFRVYYLTHAQVLQPVNDQLHVRADGVEYYAYARNLARHGVFSKATEGTSPLIGDSFRDPGYPLFLAGWLKIFPQWDAWYAAVLFSQGLLSALSVVLAMCIGRRWMPMRWLAGAGVLMAIWPHSVSMGSFILSETLFGFLCLLGMFLLDHALHRRSTAWATVGGFGFALGALTNAVLLPFAPLLGLYFAYRRQISAAMLTGLLAGAMILPAAWMTRNALLPHSLDNSSTGRALDNFVQGSWPILDQAYQASMKNDPLAVATMARIGQESDLIKSDPAAGLVELMRRMGHHPLEYAGWYLSKPALLWDWDIRIGQGDIYVYPTRNSPFKDNALYRSVIAVCHTLNPLLFLLMITGGIVALWPRQKLPRSLVASTLLLAFITVVFSVLQAEPRYSIAYRPLEILLATFAAYRGSLWLVSMRIRGAGKPAPL